MDKECRHGLRPCWKDLELPIDSDLSVALQRCARVMSTGLILHFLPRLEFYLTVPRPWLYAYDGVATKYPTVFALSSRSSEIRGSVF